MTELKDRVATYLYEAEAYATGYERDYDAEEIIKDQQARIKELEVQNNAYRALQKSMDESEPLYRRSYYKAVTEIEKLTPKADSVDSEREMNATLTIENVRLEEENIALRAAIENHLKYPLMGTKELKEVLGNE